MSGPEVKRRRTRTHLAHKRLLAHPHVLRAVRDALCDGGRVGRTKRPPVRGRQRASAQVRSAAAHARGGARCGKPSGGARTHAAGVLRACRRAEDAPRAAAPVCAGRDRVVCAPPPDGVQRRHGRRPQRLHHHRVRALAEVRRARLRTPAGAGGKCRQGQGSGRFPTRAAAGRRLSPAGDSRDAASRLARVERRGSLAPAASHAPRSARSAGTPLGDSWRPPTPPSRAALRGGWGATASE